MNSNIKDDTDNSTKVIDLVGKLFQTIANSKKIPSEIQLEIAKLQTPYIKIAIEAPNLFALENHQSRIFLKTLCNISCQQNPKDKSHRHFVKKINNIVDKISDFKTYDKALFIQLESDLHKFLNRQKKRSEIIKKRILEKNQGHKKILLAKKNTKKMLLERLPVEKTHKFVKTILIEEWFNVLVLINLRHNTQSKEYQTHLGFIDLLIECTDIESNEIISLEKIQLLLEGYKNGLELVAFNHPETFNKTNELFSNISNLQKSKQIKFNKIQASKLIEPEDILKISSHNRKPTVTKQTSEINISSSSIIDYSKIIESLKEGQLFELESENGDNIKAKLSWVNPVTGDYLFVDSNGLKIAVQTKDELEESLEFKTIKILKA